MKRAVINCRTDNTSDKNSSLPEWQMYPDISALEKEQLIIHILMSTNLPSQWREKKRLLLPTPTTMRQLNLRRKKMTEHFLCTKQSKRRNYSEHRHDRHDVNAAKPAPFYPQISVLNKVIWYSSWPSCINSTFFHSNKSVQVQTPADKQQTAVSEIHNEQIDISAEQKK